MLLIPLIVFGAGALVSIVFLLKATAHLTELGGAKYRSGVGALFWGRENFTDRGWRYRNISQAAALIGFILAMFFLDVSS